MPDEPARAPARRVAVIGDGSWGTALALVLHENGVATTMWCAFPEQVEALRRDRENRRFLPGVPLQVLETLVYLVI